MAEDMMSCLVSYRAYSEGDAFLPLFFIVCIVFAVVTNLTLMATISKDNTLDQNGYLRIMCYINITAGLTAIPLVLVISVWSDIVLNDAFCGISGVLTNFLHGASMLNICAINFGRYQAVAYPMKHRYSSNLKATRLTSAFVILLPLFLSILPFFFLPTPYGPLSHAPLCVTLPKTTALAVIGYIDVAFTFAIPWTIMMTTSAGMLRISYKLSHAVVHPIQVVPANVRINENVCVKGDNGLAMNRRSRLFMKDSIRRDRTTFARPNNAKAMITVATTFCIFSVLNGPSAAFVIAVRSSFTCSSTQSTDHPALEYLFCVTSIAGYVVYPLLNGLTSREVRLKMLQMVRNRLSVKILDLNEFEGSTITNWNERNVRRPSVPRDLATATRNHAKPSTHFPNLSSTSRTKKVTELSMTHTTVEYHVNTRITSAPQRHTPTLMKADGRPPYKLRKIPAALLPHSVSCPTARKIFTAVNESPLTKEKSPRDANCGHPSGSATTGHSYTLPCPVAHQIPI